MMINPDKIYPKEKIKIKEYMDFNYHKFEKGIEYYFFMTFNIQSIYYEEVGDEKLKYDLRYLYKYDTTNKKITFLGTWKR